MRIRVLRLIEYSYDSAETMAQDMALWTLQHHVTDGSIRIKSATLPPDVLSETSFVETREPEPPPFAASEGDASAHSAD